MPEETYKEWFEDPTEEENNFDIDEYDITSAPNDFNAMTLFSFIESGAIKIPGFQRNYVWDIYRASKLIESLILGLPVPQIFLYEESRNKFLVIDGQQRLMTIYYFMKQRFPKKEKRVELRKIFDDKRSIPSEILHDDSYFQNFNLSLPSKLPGKKNKFNGINYSTLGEYKQQFDLRTIRNVIVKQNEPKNDDSSIYEIFGRLNTGGINLKPQEIRISMYHSDFYDMLFKNNLNENWRRILQQPEPDLHLKDLEILLRGFAMLISGKDYKSSMTSFLNQFSRLSKTINKEGISYFDGLLVSFLKSTEKLDKASFINKATNKFSIALYEAVFFAACIRATEEKRLCDGYLDQSEINRLENDKEFIEASQKSTAEKKNVDTRLNKAKEIITSL